LELGGRLDPAAVRQQMRGHAKTTRFRSSLIEQILSFNAFAAKTMFSVGVVLTLYLNDNCSIGSCVADQSDDVKIRAARVRAIVGVIGEYFPLGIEASYIARLLRDIWPSWEAELRVHNDIMDVKGNENCDSFTY